MNSTFQIDLPVFVWVAIVGMVVCALFGFCMNWKSETGARKENDSFGALCASLVLSLGFGVMTVITCLRYSVVIPKFFLWKIGLYGLSIAAIGLLSMMFWGITFTVSLLLVDDKGTEVRRQHRKCQHHR